jgi:hypothetical protein
MTQETITLNIPGTTNRAEVFGIIAKAYGYTGKKVEQSIEKREFSSPEDAQKFLQEMGYDAQTRSFIENETQKFLGDVVALLAGGELLHIISATETDQKLEDFAKEVLGKAVMGLYKEAAIKAATIDKEIELQNIKKLAEQAVQDMPEVTVE